jgi:flagellar basal-body rod protein FlgG
MYGILNVSRTGMSATQNKINVISNNVVNANTTGYKKLEVGFEDLLLHFVYLNTLLFHQP